MECLNPVEKNDPLDFVLKFVNLALLRRLLPSQRPTVMDVYFAFSPGGSIMRVVRARNRAWWEGPTRAGSTTVSSLPPPSRRRPGAGVPSHRAAWAQLRTRPMAPRASSCRNIGLRMHSPPVLTRPTGSSTLPKLMTPRFGMKSCHLPGVKAAEAEDFYFSRISAHAYRRVPRTACMMFTLMLPSHLMGQAQSLIMDICVSCMEAVFT